MEDDMVDPPGFSSGASKPPPGSPMMNNKFLIGGGIAVVIGVLYYMRKKNAAASSIANGATGGPTTTSVIYPSTTATDNTQALQTYYNELMTAVQGGTNTTTQNITDAKNTLSTQITANASTNKPSPTPTGTEHFVPAAYNALGSWAPAGSAFVDAKGQIFNVVPSSSQNEVLAAQGVSQFYQPQPGMFAVAPVVAGPNGQYANSVVTFTKG